MVMQFASSGTAGRRRAALAVFAACAVVGLVVVVASASRSAARPPLPDPNGYDDFVGAGALVIGPVPNQGNWATADLGELRAFVAANRAALDRARLGIGRPAVVSPADGHAGQDRVHAQVQAIRTLSRVLLAEGRVARQDGNLAEAVDTSFRTAELGQVTATGALLIGAQVGWIVEVQAMDQLRALADRLTAAEIRAGLPRLADLDRRCPTVAEVMAVEDRWFDGSFSWWQRMMMGWQNIRAQAVAATLPALRTSRDRVVRATRAARLAWAARLFEQENGRPPRAAAELVPAILPDAPLDPATGRPMGLPAAP